MLYIHQITCISPQQGFPDLMSGSLRGSVDNKLQVIEPVYDAVSQNAFRRMAKAVRIGAAAALQLIRHGADGAFRAIDGIIIGTSNAGMEQSIQFVQQIIDHEEGMLTPGAFIQSTPNTIAAQVSFLTRNKKYNITHVHGGLAFENALIDALMLLVERPSTNYLLGGVDEIGAHNYNIDFLEGWYKKEPLPNKDLYETDSPGSLVGEGAAMFRVSDEEAGALAGVRAISTLHSKDPGIVQDRLQWFLDKHLPAGERIDLLLSGENGDNRLLPFFSGCEDIALNRDTDIAIARFKHMSGEYPTASAFALWLACQLAGDEALPEHMIKRRSAANRHIKNVLIYNTHKGMQHSFMLVSGIG